MARTLLELGCDAEKTKVQRLGIDPGEFSMMPRTMPDDGIVRVLIVAAFREKKGIPLALEAVANVIEMGTKIQVTVVGDSLGEPREEAEKSRIREVVARRHLAPIVRFLGFQPHERVLQEAYSHHIFLSPSRTAGDGDSEGGAPVVLVEMAATGMPIVSTWHCDIPQVVFDGKTGLLAREEDVGDLTRCLSTMAQSPSRWPEYGAAGRQLVEGTFDARTLCAELAEAYESLF